MKATVLTEPFSHIIAEDVYTEDELERIWDEFKFFNKPGKLKPPEKYGGIVGATDSKAIALTGTFQGDCRVFSDILMLEEPMLTRLLPHLKKWKQTHYSLQALPPPNLTSTKLRYYYDGESYDSHTDSPFAYIIFQYFYKEPKKFTGGELFFGDFDYEFPCNNNTLIVMPSYIKHGVRTVNIDENNYHAGNGRYAITMFVDYPKR